MREFHLRHQLRLIYCRLNSSTYTNCNLNSDSLCHYQLAKLHKTLNVYNNIILQAIKNVRIIKTPAKHGFL